MRVATTTERGPVATMPSDQVNAEFSHLMWTNFSGPDRVYQGKDWVAVRDTGPIHIVTVMVR